MPPPFTRNVKERREKNPVLMALRKIAIVVCVEGEREMKQLETQLSG